MLPGLDGTGMLFAPLLRALPYGMHVKVIAYPASDKMGYEELCDFCADQLPDGPVVVLGESFSGPVATLLAHRFPDRVKGLILAASFVSAPLPGFVAPLLHLPGILHFAKKFARFPLIGLRSEPEVTKLLAKTVSDLPTPLLRFRALQVMHANYSEQFRRAACSVLVLHGSQDVLVSAKRAKKMCKMRPNAKLSVLDGPHMLLQVKPLECAAEIAGFYAACQADPA
jgi:pimeloyl-[acyl-carrier protein] methyl ester esterase